MKWKSREILGRAVALAAAYGITNLLETKPGRKFTRHADARAGDLGDEMGELLERVASNARDHRILLIAGGTAIVAGVVLLALAARPARG
jgi:hypothetical protein